MLTLTFSSKGCVSGEGDLPPSCRGRVGEGVKAQQSAPTSTLPLPLPAREGRINWEFGHLIRKLG